MPPASDRKISAPRWGGNSRITETQHCEEPSTTEPMSPLSLLCIEYNAKSIEFLPCRVVAVVIYNILLSPAPSLPIQSHHRVVDLMAHILLCGGVARVVLELVGVRKNFGKTVDSVEDDNSGNEEGRHRPHDGSVEFLPEKVLQDRHFEVGWSERWCVKDGVRCRRGGGTEL